MKILNLQVIVDKVEIEPGPSETVDVMVNGQRVMARSVSSSNYPFDEITMEVDLARPLSLEHAALLIHQMGKYMPREEGS